MYDDIDVTDIEPEPPPTKTVGQSVVAVAIALGVGTAITLLLRIHYLASLIGDFTWMAATIAPSFYAANYVYKMMAGFHVWAQLTVGVIVFFSVALFIVATLKASNL